MSFGNAARVLTVVAACAAAAGSATSGSNQSQPAAQAGASSAPPPQQMEPTRALGVWRSTFGAVKIEADLSHGGLPSGGVHGVWLYQRQGQDVVGYFSGTLRGTVLQFRWQEPNNPPLTGEGYLVFDAEGRQYTGRWWSDKRDRVGDWNGWRAPTTSAASGSTDPGQYGDSEPQPAPARRPSPYQRQPYQPQPNQPQPYQPQPYQPQPYQPQPNQPQPYQPNQPQPYQPQPYQPQPQPTTYY